ncbi:MAG: hypothetical protein AMXMBFR20_16530 [Planctomycetia bacterium]
MGREGTVRMGRGGTVRMGRGGTVRMGREGTVRMGRGGTVRMGRVRRYGSGCGGGLFVASADEVVGSGLVVRRQTASRGGGRAVIGSERG